MAFELRTDGHGVIRSDKGIIITTHGRQAAGGHVKEIGQTNAQLQSATSTHQALMQSSIQAQCETRSLDSTLMPTLDTLNASMTGESTTHEDEQITYPELSCPHLALSSLAGIAMTAKQNIHITTQDNLAITASKDLSLATTSKYNLNVQNGINIFSQTGGIKHYSAKDDIELQAQDGQIKHIAKDTIHITSTENGIHIISPTQITLNAAGSELKINEHGIFITTPKTFRVKSEQKVFEGGGKVPFRLPNLLLKPNLKELEEIELIPNRMTACTGVLGCIKKQGGFSNCQELFIDNVLIEEFWLSLDGIIYYVPPNNISNSDTVTVDGRDYTIKESLIIVENMQDVLYSLSQQFDNLNQLKKEYVAKLGRENANIVLMNGLNRYLMVLEHIHTLHWEQVEFLEFYQKISETQLNFKGYV